MIQRAIAALAVCAAIACAQGGTAAHFKVRLTAEDGGATVDLPMERYVAGVLAGESGVFKSEEALKAMAVAARTYAVRLRGRHSAEGFDFCATTHCQRVDLGAVTPRLEAIAAATAGELLWWEGKPAFACYSRDCGGRTEDASAVWPELAAPYLRSHEDVWCAGAQGSGWRWSGSPSEIGEALRRSGLKGPADLERVTITERTSSGRARTLALSGRGDEVRISAGSFRFAIGRALGWNTLLSDRYETQASNGKVSFEGFGAGHGVGLCQLGAERMGSEGHSYREILAYYYPGTAIGLTGRGLAWQQLGGEHITLYTTLPAQDGAVLGIAERQLRAAADRSGVPAPSGIEIRVYPDLDSFRNATGEPGWVAAYTQNRRIAMQPATTLKVRGSLEATLRHEMLHVLVDSQALAALPLWFREGLVGYLAGAGGSPAASSDRPPRDADIRQTSDPARARRAYAQAERAVATLVHRYGEGTVLGWLRAGLPPEVRNTSASQDATKSK